MKVLFVPFPEGNVAHYIPLLALNNMLSGSSVERAFFVKHHWQKLLKRTGLTVLDMAYEGFRSEMQAYGRFRPDVVVDDHSCLTTGYATKLAGIPRVVIQRTGWFPGSEPRNSRHHDCIGRTKAQLQPIVDALPDVTSLGLPQPRTYSDLFDAEIKIVPGIKSVELLPEPLRDDPTYVFSGPLIIEDYMIRLRGLDDSTRQSEESDDVATELGRKMARYEDVNLSASKDFDSLRLFFENNKHRRIVYVTMGTIGVPNPSLNNCLRYLLNNGIAVVSSVKVDGVGVEQEELYYYAEYLPMHFTCSNVDLMIHHCGCGTYNYALIHNLPAITIGTMIYERDDVAMRLQELGASVHVPAAEECDDFEQLFREAIERYFGNSDALLSETKKNINLLRLEIERTVSSFNFEEVLHQAVLLKKQGR